MDAVGEEDCSAHSTNDNLSQPKGIINRSVTNLWISFYLRIIDREVQCDATLDGLAKSEVPEEGHVYVEAGDDNHGSIEDTKEASEIILSLHLIFHRQDQTNALKCEQGCSKVERELAPAIIDIDGGFLDYVYFSGYWLPGCKGLAVFDRWQSPYKIGHCQGETNHLDHAGQH